MAEGGVGHRGGRKASAAAEGGAGHRAVVRRELLRQKKNVEDFRVEKRRKKKGKEIRFGWTLLWSVGSCHEEGRVSLPAGGR